MCGGNALHFDLVFAVARIDVIEVRFAGGRFRNNRNCVHRLGQVDYRPTLGGSQPQVVPAAVVRGYAIGRDAFRKSRYCRTTQYNQVTEIEIVADTAGLIVNERVQAYGAVGFPVAVIGINNCGLGITSHVEKSSYSNRVKLDVRSEHPQQVRCAGFFEPSQYLSGGGCRTQIRRLEPMKFAIPKLRIRWRGHGYASQCPNLCQSLESIRARAFTSPSNNGGNRRHGQSPRVMRKKLILTLAVARRNARPRSNRMQPTTCRCRAPVI